MRQLRLLLPLAATLAAVPAVPAQAATRHADASSDRATGLCTADAPCTLAHAINGAAANDVVSVAPGDYVVHAPLITSVPLHIRGEAGQPRPRIVGGSALGATTLTFKRGGSLKHLHLEATGSGLDALTLGKATAERLIITSATGDGAKVVASAATTVLRDSIVRTQASGSSSAALKLRDRGANDDDDGSTSSASDAIALVNVTAVAAAGSATAVRCETAVGQTSIVNSIIRGADTDVDASNNGARCAVTATLLRSDLSPGVAADPSNRDADPRFSDPEAGNYAPLADGPGVDGGVAHAHLGATDVDGRARTLGAAPDMGAFELDAGDPPSADDPTDFPPPPAEAIADKPADNGAQKPVTDGQTTDRPTTTTTTTTATPTPEPDASPPPPLPVALPVAPPALGRTVVLEPARGTVLVRLPGAAQAVPLEAAASLPVGTVIDATNGTVTLTSALDARGQVQTGTFHGGAFEPRQAREGGGMVELVLRGGSFAGCGRATARAATDGPVAYAAARKRRVVRKLWGKDRSGRFRTRGRTSVATVRGTRWLTVDRCDGTLTRVTEGAVEVRDLRTGARKLVRAGGRHLVRRAP